MAIMRTGVNCEPDLRIGIVSLYKAHAVHERGKESLRRLGCLPRLETKSCQKTRA